MRLTNVSLTTTEENTYYSERLRAEYKGAFDEWALEVGRLQAVSNAPDSSVMQQAEERVAAAETAYRSSRDRLTEHLTRTP
jgi:hypothetical protein